MNLSLPNNNILIIDKNLKDLEPLKVILGIYGYKVTICNDSLIALHKALRRTPDLVVIESSMSDIEGFELIKFLRHYEETEDAPIIFLSDENSADTKMKAFALGADDFITKPFQIDEVIARISIHLGKIEKQKALEYRINELETYTASIVQDIKSPLGIMNGFADQLSTYWDEYDDGSKKTFIEVINRNSNKVSEIIDELLTLSYVSQTDIVIQPIRMSEVIDNIKLRLEQYQSDFKANVVYPAEWPIVLGHAPWIEEVWINYLSNAMKYGSQEFDIEVGYTPVGSEMIQFWVKNSGGGLTEEEQEVVFKKYTRLKTDNQKGYGLGLSIVKRIIEKLEGEVGVTSEVGVETKFYFTLPVQKI